MNRRELLVKSGLFFVALTLTPSRTAAALGGVVLESGTTVPDF
ncbi:MAG: peroxiredoxin, partial [Cyanobium sp. RS427]|nr:peroxiredoxin [Cyanobium sp. RS427]